MPLIACWSSLQRDASSYLQAWPPHPMEQCMWAGITNRSVSPTTVYVTMAIVIFTENRKQRNSPQTCAPGLQEHRELPGGLCGFCSVLEQLVMVEIKCWELFCSQEENFHVHLQLSSSTFTFNFHLQL